MAHPVDNLLQARTLLYQVADFHAIAAGTLIHQTLQAYSHHFPRVGGRVAAAEEAYFFTDEACPGLPLGLLGLPYETTAVIPAAIATVLTGLGVSSEESRVLIYQLDVFQILCETVTGRYFIGIADEEGEEIFDINDEMDLYKAGDSWRLTYGMSRFDLTDEGLKLVRS